MASNDSNNRYNQRGVSSSKDEVHQVVDKLDRGCFPGAFCKVTNDLLTGNKNMCNIIHSDGAGTKSACNTNAEIKLPRSKKRL